jgi:DNA-binding CsgD family transcriptional regulator
MRGWQEDMLTALEDESLDEQSIFGRMERAAIAVGFEYCAYGLRVPIPVTKPQIVMLNNYPDAWRRRYQEAGYVQRDPTVLHGRRSQAPIVWSDALFAGTEDLWTEARAHGLRVGWAQSSLDGHGIGGMLTLARSRDDILPGELVANEVKMRWLVNMAHLALSRRMAPKVTGRPDSPLTPREVEILQWTADGKTAGEISDILHVSEHTVAFHMGNAMRKLDSSNKTAAVVKAAVLGLLN